MNTYSEKFSRVEHFNWYRICAYLLGIFESFVQIYLIKEIFRLQRLEIFDEFSPSSATALKAGEYLRLLVESVPCSSLMLSGKFNIVWLSGCLSESRICLHMWCSCMLMLTNHLDDKVSTTALALGHIGENQADILLFSWTKQHWWYQYHEKYHTYYFTSINIQRTICRGWREGTPLHPLWWCTQG